jgi:hypothetical protein
MPLVALHQDRGVMSTPLPHIDQYRARNAMARAAVRNGTVEAAQDAVADHWPSVENAAAGNQSP